MNTQSDHLIRGSFCCFKGLSSRFSMFPNNFPLSVLGAKAFASFVSQDEMWIVHFGHFHPKLSDNYRVISR